MTHLDKNDLIAQVVQQLENQKKLLVEAANEAREYSTNEESKAENKYDTRGLEASYLASGQSKRAQEIQAQIYQLNKVQVKDFTDNDPIGISALVEILMGESNQKYLYLLPVGGVELSVMGMKIQTITLESPIGRNVYQQKPGHDFEINGNVYEILEVK